MRYGRFIRRRRRKLPFSNISPYWGSVEINCEHFVTNINRRETVNDSLTQCPIVPFSFATSVACNFYKTFIQTEIVAYGILPAFFILLVIRIIWCDICVNLAQRSSMQWRMLRIDAILVEKKHFLSDEKCKLNNVENWDIHLNGHSDECNVTVRWLFVCIFAFGRRINCAVPKNKKKMKRK